MTFVRSHWVWLLLCAITVLVGRVLGVDDGGLLLMAAVYPGRKGVVYLSTTGTGAAVNVIKLNQWTLNKATDKIEVTAFGDANKTYVQGLPDIQGTLSGFWDDTETKPFTAAASADGCKMYLYPSADKPTSYHYGPAWLDMSMDTSVNGAVTISGSFAANGSWGSIAI